MSSMTVARAGNCAPANQCSIQVYRYKWDEVGRLVDATRQDPSGPGAHLEYAYDSSDNRVRKTVVSNGDERHTIYVFGSLELRLAESTATGYTVDDSTEVPYLFGHGVRLARVTYTDAADFQTDRRRIFLELGDHLGSTSVVLDHATGELVERSTAFAYGSAESNYRTQRWDHFREDYRFTGKEDDIEVGLIYFGARYLNPQLGRWISADPLAVHAPGKADLNLYAYVHGRVLVAVDPVGLCGTNQSCASAADEMQGEYEGATNVTQVEAAVDAGGNPVSGTPTSSATARTSSPRPAPAGNFGAYKDTGQLSGSRKPEPDMEDDFLRYGNRDAAIIGVGALGPVAVYGAVTAAPLALAGTTFATMLLAGGKKAIDSVSQGDPAGVADGILMIASSLPGLLPEGLGSGPTSPGQRPKSPGPTIDPATGREVGRIVVDPKGNAMIEPVGGSTVPAGKGGVDTHTTYPNGSNYQRLNPQGHQNNPTPHGHGHGPGTGPGMKGQGPSLAPDGRQVPFTSPDAHWPAK